MKLTKCLNGMFTLRDVFASTEMLKYRGLNKAFHRKMQCQSSLSQAGSDA